MDNEKKDVCIGLEFGTSLNVQFKGLGSSKGSIIGIDRDRCLIIRPPVMSGIETMLFKKNQTIVSYLYDGMVYGFRCTLLGSIKTPFPLLILSYPEVSETLNLRKQRRLACLLPGQILFEDSALKMVVVDISPAGCRLTVPDPIGLDMAHLGMGATIKFSVEMKEIDETPILMGSVKNFLSDGSGLVIGVEFLKAINQVDLQVIDRVKRFISAVRESIHF